jgi:DNA repair protein RadC
MNKVNNEDHPRYLTRPYSEPGFKPGHTIPGKYSPGEFVDIEIVKENGIIEQALNILASRMKQFSVSDLTATCPDDVKSYFKMKLMPLEHEVFAVMFLNNKHQMIDFQEMFRGTIDSASVYPREVIKEAMKQNAAAIIVGHNHPSGCPEPSKSDEQITYKLRDACKLLQIRLLDHVIVGGMDTVSLAGRGII